MAQVTLKDVYEVANNIEDKLDKLSSRVNSLEQWKSEMMGRLAVATSIIVLVSNLLFTFIKDKLKI